MLLVATTRNYKPIMQFNWGSCKKKKLYQFFLFLLYYWILNGGGVETDLPIPRGPLEELQFSALLLQLDYLFLEVTTCLQLLLLLLEPLFSFYKFFNIFPIYFLKVLHHNPDLGTLHVLVKKNAKMLFISSLQSFGGSPCFGVCLAVCEITSKQADII